MRTLTQIPIGTKIKLTKRDEDHEEDDIFKVVEVYTHHVVCENAKGIRQSVTNADLYTRKMAQPCFELPTRETAQLTRKKRG